MREKGRLASVWYRARRCRYSAVYLLLFAVSTLFSASMVHAAPPDYFEADCAFHFCIAGKFIGSTPEAADKAGGDYYETMAFYPSKTSVKACTWTYPMPGAGWYACPGEICVWTPDPNTGMPRWRCYPELDPVWGRCNTVNQGATPTPSGPVCPDPPPPADTCPVGKLTTTHVSYPLNTDQLTDRAKDAIGCLETCIGKSRATILSSAYRPSAYQDHLREVWNVWKKLALIKSPNCEELRNQVEKEFFNAAPEGHQLSGSTKEPAATSCHSITDKQSIGRCFDVHGWFTETVDFCSTQCNVYRPWPADDPVHVAPF